MSRDKISDQFRRLYESDMSRGRPRSLESYQRVFRGFEDVIAQEYARLAAATPSQAPPASGGPDLAAGRPGPSLSEPATLSPEDAATERARESAEASGDGLLARLSRRGAPAYDELGEIARGGMGAILRVHDGVLSRDLAKKVILTRGGPGDAELRGRFVAEAQVTARLDHPGVVPIHELGVDDEGRLYFTMKLVSGRTLGDVLALTRGGSEGWTTTRVLGLIGRVCETLAFAHSRGVVHRDVKPANVMVGDYGEVYLMDWGLAKAAVPGRAEAATPGVADVATLVPAPATPASTTPSTPGGNLTMDGAVLGTPGYMAPEQALGTQAAVDARSDVFAIGAIVYELLAGAAPYAGADGRVDPLPAILALRAGPPAPLASLAPSAPDELVAIVEKAMDREPARRYPDAAALALDLRNYLDGRVVLAHRTGPVVELVKWVRRNRALASAVGAAVVLLVAGLATNLSLLGESRRETEKARRMAYRANLYGAAVALRDHDSSAARTRLDAAADGRASDWEQRVLDAQILETSEIVDATGVEILRDGGRRILTQEGVLLERDADGRERVLLDVRPRRVTHYSADLAFAIIDAAGRSQYAVHDYSLVRVADGERIMELACSADVINQVVLHPLKPWLIRHTDGGTLRLVDCAAGRDIAVAADGPAWGLSPPVVVDGDTEHPDGVFIVHRPDLAMELRDVRTFAIVAVFRGHTEGAMAWICPRTGLVYTASSDDSVRAWDPKAPATSLWRTAGPRLRDPLGIAGSPDGKTLAVSPIDGALVLLSADDGAERLVLHGPARTLGGGYGFEEGRTAFTPDGTRVVTPQGIGKTAIWDVSEGDPRVLRGHSSFVYTVEVSPDGSLLASAAWDGFAGTGGAVRFWDAETGAPVAANLDAPRFAVAGAFDRSGRRFHAQTLRIGEYALVTGIDVSTGRITSAPAGVPTSVAFSPSRTRAAVLIPTTGDPTLPGNPQMQPAAATWSLRTVDLETGRVLAEGPEFPRTELGAAFAADAAIAIDAAGGAGPVRILDPATLTPRFDLTGHTGTPWTAVSSPDGRLLVTGAADGSARVWDAADGAPLRELKGHGTAAYAAAFSPDGRILAVGGADGKVHIWDAATWEELTAFHGHTNYVKTLAWSKDGRTLFSGSGDGTIRVWTDQTVSQRAAARDVRNRVVAAWRPRVAAKLDGTTGEAFESAASAMADAVRGDASLPPRERDIALQVLLEEAVARRAR